jgi:hypothetical protein
VIGLGNLVRPIISRLRASRAEFAIVGGLAVSVRTVPRFTKDADLAVLVSSDAEAEHITFAVARDGYQVSALISNPPLAGSRLRGSR